MVYNKPIFIICVYLTALFGGCAGTQTAAVQEPQSPLEWEGTIDVPAQIKASERAVWEKQLFLLPPTHRARRDLRDRLVESYYEEFRRLDAGDIERRRTIFEYSLGLHLPRDFAPEKVSARLEEMAEWIVSNYEKQGHEALVTVAYRLQVLLHPDHPSHLEDYNKLRDWSQSVRGTIADPVERLSSHIGLHLQIIQLMPEIEQAHLLAGLMVERHRRLYDQFEEGSSQSIASMSLIESWHYGEVMRRLPLDLISVFFIAGDVAGARSYLEGLVVDGYIGPEPLEVIDQIVHNRNRAEAYYLIARHLVGRHGNSRAALRACMYSRAIEPAQSLYSLCVGQVFEQLDRHENAVDFYLEAADKKPEQEVFVQVVELVRRALLRVHLAEDVEGSRRVVVVSDKFIDRTLSLTPDADPEVLMGMASLLHTIGVVEFDDGELDGARLHFVRSFEVFPNVGAIVKMAEIEYMSDQFDNALALLDRAQEFGGDARRLDPYHMALIAERRGDLYNARGEHGKSRDAYGQALGFWKLQEIQSEKGAEAAVRRGVILDRLGDHQASKDSFRQAIRLDPNRDITYTDTISYLVMRGRLEDALEFYRLAYNQDRIDAMWKIYYALWVDGLSRRQLGQAVDLARGYLDSSDGKSWQDNLARFYSGKMSFDELKSRAINKGQRAEAEYYAALVDLAEGRDDGAREKLKRVIDSRLLGFFEYRMARELLRGPLK